MRSLNGTMIGALVVAAASCSGQDARSWKQEWVEHKAAAAYPPECTMELCDDIELAYEPECDCWCDYDGDDGDGTDDGGGGEDCVPGYDDVHDCPDDGGGGDDGGDDPTGGVDLVQLDCTYTQGYWKNHNELGTNRRQARDWPAPLDERDELCGQTLLDLLNTRAHGDAWIILAHQFIAASLNAAAGADASGVAAELDEARALLESTCGGIPANGRFRALELAELLDAYNNGVIGPGSCD